MFGSLGGAEIVLILILALLLFGPRKLPGIGRMLGKSLSEFRRATQDFKMNLEHEVRLDESARTPRPNSSTPGTVSREQESDTTPSTAGGGSEAPPRDDETGKTG